MATAKFKQESPFLGINDRLHHSSDWKYDNYLQGLAAALQSSSDVGSDPVVKLALFGLGRAGSIHLNNILSNRRIELKYIVESDEAKWDVVRNALNLGHVKFVKPEDANAVYEDKDLDAVIVATPTSSHEEFICKSLEGGKAVFTEKPVSEDTSSVDRCYKLAAQLGKPLFCAFNRRFDPSFGDVRQRVLRGDLGQIHQIKLTSRDSPLPSAAYLKISGGIFHDCMVHDIDLMTHVLGEYPIEVFTVANAFCPEIADMDDYDNVVCTFRFASGTIGVVDISRFASYGYDQRLEVFGPAGMLQVDNDIPNSSIYTTNSGISKPPMFWSFPSRHAQGYVNELNHFVDVVRGHAKVSVTAEMTMAVTKMAEAAEASARQGKPMKIEWSPDEVPDGYVMN